MRRREEERDDEGWWVEPVESEDEKRHRRFNSRFHIVMGIIMVGIFVVGTWRGCESRRMERMMKNDSVTR